MPQGKIITGIYKKAGIMAPKGKHVHTPAFHKCVVGVTKGQKKKVAPAMAYAICMKQMGAKKAVNPSHRRKK